MFPIMLMFNILSEASDGSIRPWTQSNRSSFITRTSI